MSELSFNSASARVSGSYAGYMAKYEPEKRKLDFSSAVRLDVEQKPYEDNWQKLWGAQAAETVAEDGTVTYTMSGRAKLIGVNGFHYRGGADFQVSVSFDPSSYEMGQLGDTADLLAAAREARTAALRACFSGQELEERTARLETEYQGKKDEASSSFAQLVGVSLEARGQAGQVRKVYDSVQAVFASFEAKYHAIALRQPDSWAKAGAFEAAVTLRRLGAAIQPEAVKRDGLYTLRELELTAAGVRGGLDLSV